MAYVGPGHSPWHASWRRIRITRVNATQAHGRTGTMADRFEDDLAPTTGPAATGQPVADPATSGPRDADSCGDSGGDSSGPDDSAVGHDGDDRSETELLT